ncbi:MAG: hypothetical protein IMZ61_13925 [Planctomycetes bacterium]|nr:hypothetical protein [Planctomycetota bacterium]
MAKKPTKIEIMRLQEAINWSYRQLAPFRKNDKYAMEQYVGRHYSEKGADKNVPFSLLELAISTYTQRLSGGKPQVLFTTPHDQLQPQKSKLQRGTNHLLNEIDFGDTLADAVQGGFFSMGIIKMGLDQRAKVEWNGFMHDVMQPFADSVTLDNWVHDMSATRWDKVQFCGDRYSLLLEDAKEMFQHGDKLMPIGDTEGSGDNDDKLKEMTQSGGNKEYYRDIGEVWDIWDPRENLIITLAAGEGQPCDVTGEYLNVMEWNGPERGPYRLLRFNPVRGNIMPLPPVALWMDMHELANNVMRKLGRQAGRQKTVFGAQPGGEADADTTIQANDGDIVKLLNPKNIATMNFPGVDPQQLAFLIQLKNMASWLWGNLDALGGLSPQADTLGQDRLLTASASQRLVKMQNTTMDYAHSCILCLSELLYQDPGTVLGQTKRHGNIEIPVYWTPEDREADFIEYNMKLEPYSLQYQSPTERLETIRQTMLQMVAPFMQQMMAQGIHVDFEKLYRIISEYTGIDELNQILIYTNPRTAQEGPEGTGRALQSPSTTRTNVRVNRPGATSQGRDEAMVGQLLGMGQQASQTAQINRPVG